MSQRKIRINIPEAFKGLFDPYRFKVFYGGRGGAKSHNFARALLVLGMRGKIRVLCARELQNSITDSVHKLLADIIYSHGLESFYTVQKATIFGRNGTEFIFKGLKHNATEVKSTEGIDYCWVEEAEKVSDNSWEVLIPTIRKAGSEIWISFNPKNPTDPTYIRFVANADDDMLVKKVSWRDNPYFPDVLEQERKRLEKLDPVAYAHIWEGEFDERFHGSVYAEILKQSQEAGRISTVPFKAGIPVITAWDLGHSDSTSIWFAQKIGLEIRVIDFYEANHQPLSHFADIIREKPYSYDTHYLPHDGRHERLGMQGSIKDQLAEMGVPCETLPPMTLNAGIELTRALLNECWIDKQNCAEGLHALHHYHFKYDENKGRFKDKPEHDWSSHASDAMRYLAMALDSHQPETESTPYAQNHYSAGSWMN